MKNNLLSERLVYNGESQTPTHLHLCTYNALVMQEVSGVNFQTVANSLNREQINWFAELVNGALHSRCTDFRTPKSSGKYAVTLK